MKRPGTEESESSLPLNLDALLEPMTSCEFFDSHCSKSYLYAPGWPEKFTQLLPWADLNRLLLEHAPESPRLLVFKSGVAVDPGVYTESRVRDGKGTPRIKVKEFTAELRQGATLILNNVHKMYAPLTSLAESMERCFGAAVGINVYAGWRTSQGLPVHRDNHDVFILQVSGRKRWLLYGGDYHNGSDGRPPSEPLQEQVIHSGDLLYIPRGCWHAAFPLDEPCLHLTVSVANPSISDLLTWLADEWRKSTVGQASISQFATPAERVLFIDHMKTELLRILEPELVERYFQSSDIERGAHPHLSLPWSATPEALPADASIRVQLRSRRALSLRTDNLKKTVEFTIGGQTWQYPMVMKVLLDALKDGQAISIEALMTLGRDAMGEPLARSFLATLVKEGIVCSATMDPE